jgi:hypothetical protein
MAVRLSALRADHRPCLDDVERRKILLLPGLELQLLTRPARSQSLYRLSYRGSREGGRDVLRRDKDQTQAPFNTVMNLRIV